MFSDILFTLYIALSHMHTEEVRSYQSVSTDVDLYVYHKKLSYSLELK